MIPTFAAAWTCASAPQSTPWFGARCCSRLPRSANVKPGPSRGNARAAKWRCRFRSLRLEEDSCQPAFYTVGATSAVLGWPTGTHSHRRSRGENPLKESRSADHAKLDRGQKPRSINRQGQTGKIDAVIRGSRASAAAAFAFARWLARAEHHAGACRPPFADRAERPAAERGVHVPVQPLDGGRNVNRARLTGEIPADRSNLARAISSGRPSACWPWPLRRRDTTQQ